MNPNTLKYVISIFLLVDLYSAASIQNEGSLNDRITASNKTVPLFGSNNDESTELDSEFPPSKLTLLLSPNPGTTYQKNGKLVGGSEKKIERNHTDTHPLNLSDYDDDDFGYLSEHEEQIPEKTPNEEEAFQARESEHVKELRTNIMKKIKNYLNGDSKKKKKKVPVVEPSSNEKTITDILKASTTTPPKRPKKLFGRTLSFYKSNDKREKLDSRKNVFNFSSKEEETPFDPQSCPLEFNDEDIKRVDSASSSTLDSEIKSIEHYQQKHSLIKLPMINRKRIFGEDPELDILLSKVLYNPGDLFEPLLDPKYSMIGMLLPLSRSELGKKLYEDRIAKDLNDIKFYDQIRNAKLYLSQKYHNEDNEDIMDKTFEDTIEVTNEVRKIEFEDAMNAKKIQNELDSEFWDEDHLKESAKTFVVSSLAKGSTLKDENKLGEAVQRVIFTPSDIFYYNGMLNLALFFSVEFDSNRADGFFDQFINTLFSGVYGPCRKDLFYISRIQDIPPTIIDDKMIIASLFNEDEEVRTMLEHVIENLKSYFLDPSNREYLRKIFKDDLIGYEELNRVPKTIEDVFEATFKILDNYWYSNKIPVNRDELRNLIKSPHHFKHLQNFYLDIFTFEKVENLFKVFLETFQFKSLQFQKHAAAFLYAAYFETIIQNIEIEGDLVINEKFEIEDLISKLNNIVNVKIGIDSLNSVHKRSINDANKDLNKIK